MGRDMFTIIKDTKTDKIIWASCEVTGIDYEYDHGHTSFCGRYDETNTVAAFCDSKTGLCDITDIKSFDNVYGSLSDLINDNVHLQNKVRERLDDLREARRHATTAEAFCDLTDLYDEWERDYLDEYWHRAVDMRQLMINTRCKANEYAQRYGDAVDLHIYWVNDE